jgi:predicted ATPase
MMLGWAMVKRGAADAGVAKMEEGFAALGATGNQYHIPHRLTLRAEAFAAAGRFGEARDAIEQAVESVERTGEVWYEPETLRVKAEILQSATVPDIGSAERCLDQALAAARAHGARFWELRAAVALARLLEGQHRRDAARSVLTPALGGFGEARDLPEIGQAVALLDQLRR